MTQPTIELVKAPTAAPAMVEIVAPLDIEQLKKAFQKFEEFKNSLLKDTDTVKIGDKAYIKKSGWRKWALACGLSDEILEQARTPAEDRDFKDPVHGFNWRIVVRAFHTPTGRSSVGVAIASSREKTKWAHEEHDVYSLAHTRAKNRAIADLVGGGEVSAEEVEAEPGTRWVETPKK